jgi:hypothetical protein
MVIEVKDLEEGDEIIVSGLDLRYFTVLRKPQLRTKPTGWNRNIDGYKSVKVLESFQPLGYINTNRTLYFDMNYKKGWVVKRKNE